MLRAGWQSVSGWHTGQACRGLALQTFGGMPSRLVRRCCRCCRPCSPPWVNHPETPKRLSQPKKNSDEFATEFGGTEFRGRPSPAAEQHSAEQELERSATYAEFKRKTSKRPFGESYTREHIKRSILNARFPVSLLLCTATDLLLLVVGLLSPF